MKTLYEIKLRKGRIDAERIENGLDPMYASYEKEAPPEVKREKLKLVEWFQHPYGAKQDYAFFVGKKKVGRAYFNMTGYLATFDDNEVFRGAIMSHEMSLTEMRKQIAEFNRNGGLK